MTLANATRGDSHWRVSRSALVVHFHLIYSKFESYFPIEFLPASVPRCDARSRQLGLTCSSALAFPGDALLNLLAQYHAYDTTSSRTVDAVPNSGSAIFFGSKRRLTLLRASAVSLYCFATLRRKSYHQPLALAGAECATPRLESKPCPLQAVRHA